MSRYLALLLLVFAFGCGSEVIDNQPPPLPCPPAPQLAAPVFETRFGSDEQDSVSQILAAPDGGLVIGGSYQGTPDYGLGPLPAIGGGGLFIMKLTAEGVPVWQRSYLINGVERGFHIAVASDGGIAMAAWFKGSFNLGAVSFTAGVGNDIAIARLDADGNLLWAKQYIDTGSPLLDSLSLDSDDGFVLAGRVWGTLELDSGPLTATNGGEMFVARTEADGSPLWGRLYTPVAFGVAQADPAGGLVVSGRFSGSMDLGAGPLTSAGSEDMFVARLDDFGSPLWTARYGGSQQDHGAAAIDAQSRIFLSGWFGGSADVGGVTLTSSGDTDALLARLDEGGAAIWAKRAGGAGSDFGQRATPDGAGGLLLMGAFDGSFDLDGLELIPSSAAGNSGDAYLARVDAAGAPVWAQRFGCEGFEQIRSTAVVGSGDLVVAGVFDTAINLGGALLSSAGQDDIFLARLPR